MKYSYLLLCLGLLCIPMLVKSQCTTLLSTDFEGNVLSGSIDDLKKNIREGKTIRVGWQLDFDNDGKVDVEHWAPARFLTIIGEHVYTQIDEISAQGITAKRDGIRLDKNEVYWYGLIGTDSQLVNKFLVDEDDLSEIEVIVYEEMKKTGTMPVATFWTTCDN